MYGYTAFFLLSLVKVNLFDFLFASLDDRTLPKRVQSIFEEFALLRKNPRVFSFEIIPVQLGAVKHLHLRVD